MYKMVEPVQPAKIFVPVLFGVVGLLLAALLVAHCVTHIPFAKFTADPAATFGYDPIFGYISNLGILMWCASASCCFFAAGVLNMHRAKGHTVRFLVAFGILTTILMLDDLFMFHESIAPNSLNISEKWVILAYGAYAAACFYHFRRVILTNEKRYLMAAVVLLGASVVIDHISGRVYFPGEYFVEDGLKFAGIASWLAYFVTLSMTNMISMLAFNPVRMSPPVRVSREVHTHQFSHN